MIFKIISAVVFWLAISFLFSLPCLLSWGGKDIMSAKGDAKDIENVILREFDSPFIFLIFFLTSPFLFILILIRFLSSKLISFVSMSLHLIITNIHNDNGGAV